MNPEVLVACIGNIFLGDDGFGFHVAQALAACEMPTGVEVRDYGIRAIDLAYSLLRPWRAVVLVDAITRGGAPGTLYLLQPEEAAANLAATALDPHSMDAASVVAMAGSLGRVSAEIYIVGCEPASFGADDGGRMGLSPEAAARIPEAVSMIRELTVRLINTAADFAASTQGGLP